MATTAADPAAPRSVRFRLICETPPRRLENEETEYGLQDREQRAHTGQARADGSAMYEFELMATRKGAIAAPRWSGRYVHGTAAAPFVYLS